MKPQTIHQYHRRFTMNSLQGSKFRFVIAALMIAGLAFVGCENDKIGTVAGPSIEVSGDDGGALAKKKKNNGKNNNDTGNDTGNTQSWPITASKTFRYKNNLNGYQGGEIEFGNDNKSKFKLEDNALTPPPGTQHKKNVTITMEIDYDSNANELIFTFGPHGSQFSPRAELKLDYGQLGITVPKLYYIDDDGTRIEQQPEQVDSNKKWLKIRVDHFSRYALVHG